jgi:TRAP transporter 4TM/12TM fusion protein
MSDDSSVGLGGSRFRTLGHFGAGIVAAINVAIAVLGGVWAVEAHNELDWVVFKEQFLALIFTLGMAAIFIAVKSHGADDRTAPPWYDWLMALGSVVVGGYVVVDYAWIVLSMGSLGAERIALGAAAVVLVLEATRRLVGWSLVVLVVIFIFYAKFSHLFPGPLNLPSASWERIAVYLYLDKNGLFGTPIDVTATIVIAYVLFGRVLYAVNGDKFLTDFAMSIMGRYRGGSAKVAVVASSLFGTASGSAVSNVAMDGPITIPMMKNSGYAPHLAAAIEATASTGGQIMPPVMGITAFLIAEYLAVPYGDVVLAALIPAILYYVAVFTQIDLEAGKAKLTGFPAASLPRFRDVMGRGWVFFIPVAVLFYTLVVEDMRPERSAMLTVGVTLVVALFRADTRPTWRGLLKALEETGQTILDLIAITASAGVVIGALQLSGLSFNFSLMLVEFAAGSAIVLLVMTALVCIVLGMGMPTGVIYLMLAVLVAPALTQFGVAPMAAHLFLFYFGMMSMITPPVCMATYMAAAIARADFWRTGWIGMRLGIAAYIVPFVFAFQPELVAIGPVGDVLTTAALAAAGVVILCVGIVGYLFAPLGWTMRALFVAAGGLVLAAPPSGFVGWALNAGGLALAAALWWIERRAARRAVAAPA